MELSKLIAKVKVYADEVAPGTGIQLSISNLKKPIDTIIEEALGDAVVTVLADVPTVRLEGHSGKWAKTDYGENGELIIRKTIADLSGVTVVDYVSDRIGTTVQVVEDGSFWKIRFTPNVDDDTNFSQLLLSNGMYFPNIYDGKELGLLTKGFYVANFSQHTVESRSDKVVTITLPSDIIKVKEVKLSSWERSVTMAIGMEHPLYPLQRNKFTRGKQSKPVVVMDGRNKISLYTAKEDTDTVSKSEYICKVPPIAVNTTLIPLMCWAAAATYLTIVGEREAEQAWAMYKKKLEELA